MERKGSISAKAPQLQLVGYTRLGWLPRGWLDVFAELRYLDLLSSGIERGEARASPLSIPELRRSR